MSDAAPRPAYQAPWGKRLLDEHFACTASELPVSTQRLPNAELPNLQLALDEWFGELHAASGDSGVSGLRSVTGLSSDYGFVPSLTRLAVGGRDWSPAPLESSEFSVPGAPSVSVAFNCIYLCVAPAGERFAILVAQDRSDRINEIQVMGPTRKAAESVLRDLCDRALRLSVYRGRTISVNCAGVSFAALPPISRDDIVLPAHTLDLIERQTVRFSGVAQRLRDCGRHLKRGLLLHGPPGTGKTLTGMYLASRMPGRTNVIVAGLDMRALATAFDYARRLAPATIILDDVDLIAQQRCDGTDNPLLHELMNQMDGLNTDIDVLVVLTTNRPQAIERAIAERPGRVDQAIEVPYPDDDCRRRLFQLYARGVTLQLTRLDEHVARTAGTSATFIRELLRRACVIAFERSTDNTVRDEHITEALTEMTLTASAHP